MSGPLVAALVVASVCAFWVLGAYNRLMGLRNHIGQAWAKVNETLHARAQAAQPLLDALHTPLASEAGALHAAEDALRVAVQAAAAMTNGPIQAAHASAWVTAEAALSAAATRVLSLAEQHPDAPEMPSVRDGIHHWRDAEQRLRFARQVFNEAATHYNQACAAFPTRLLVRQFGFKAAGLL